MGFSLSGRAASLAAEHGLSAWAQQFRLDGLVAAPHMWSLRRPGVESVSPALTGGFLSTVPPGKSLTRLFNMPLFLEIFGIGII